MANVVFFGTPEFACQSLAAVHAFCSENHHKLLFAVSQPDKPKGRGNAYQATPVKEIALRLGIEVLQPETLKMGTTDGDAFFSRLQQEPIDIAIVVAYGRIIPPRMLAVPRHGFVNVHASLLPRWRGAAPIHRAILAGDKETGVSIMDLVKELDAGDVYTMKHLPILPTDDGDTLSKKLAQLGAKTLVDTLPFIFDGSLQKIAQPSEGITYAHMLTKDEGYIDFDVPAIDIVNRIRAMQPWPSAYSFHNGQLIKFFTPCTIIPSALEKKVAPGTVLFVGDTLHVQAKDGVLCFHEAQIQGKRRMIIRDIINGYKINCGDILHKI